MRIYRAFANFTYLFSQSIALAFRAYVRVRLLQLLCLVSCVVINLISCLLDHVEGQVLAICAPISDQSIIALVPLPSSVLHYYFLQLLELLLIITFQVFVKQLKLFDLVTYSIFR